eukprot:11223800-Lingulodinium_polyedra.AAC.1
MVASEKRPPVAEPAAGSPQRAVSPGRRTDGPAATRDAQAAPTHPDRRPVRGRPCGGPEASIAAQARRALDQLERRG